MLMGVKLLCSITIIAIKCGLRLAGTFLKVGGKYG